MTNDADAKRPPKSAFKQRRRANDERLRLLQLLIELLDTEGWLSFVGADLPADVLVSYGGSTKKLVYPDLGDVIEEVRLTIGGHSLSALRPRRKATPEELAEERSSNPPCVVTPPAREENS